MCFFLFFDNFELNNTNAGKATESSDVFDWSQPVTAVNDEPLDLKWDTENETESEKCENGDDTYPDDSGNEERIETLKTKEALKTKGDF